MSFLVLLGSVLISLGVAIKLNGVTFGISCNITDYGAKGDNRTDNTKYIQNAIQDCSEKSNKNSIGLVILPKLLDAETYFISGALFLESNIALYIEKDVTLLGTANKSNESYPYVYTRRGGIMTMTHSSLLNGGICLNISYNASEIGDQCKEWKKLEYVTIFGYGTVNGNGHSGWYNEPYSDNRPCLLNLMWIDNLNLFNVTLTNSPFWYIIYLYTYMYAFLYYSNIMYVHIYY